MKSTGLTVVTVFAAHKPVLLFFFHRQRVCAGPTVQGSRVRSGLDRKRRQGEEQPEFGGCWLLVQISRKVTSREVAQGKPVPCPVSSWMHLMSSDLRGGVRGPSVSVQLWCVCVRRWYGVPCFLYCASVGVLTWPVKLVSVPAVYMTGEPVVMCPNA